MLMGVLFHVCLFSEQNRPVSISDETMIESRLLVAGFAIGEVNLGLNSRGWHIYDVGLLNSKSVCSIGRPICELRIPGLHVNVVQRPYNTRVLAVVQDLLMVDALQKFGGEYELLISSCPDLEPTQLSSLVISPVESPQSPVPPDINSPDSNMPEVQSSDDALFSLVFNRVSALCPDDVVLPGKGARQVVSLSVKTLDIIGRCLLYSLCSTIILSSPASTILSIAHLHSDDNDCYSHLTTWFSCIITKYNSKLCI